MLNEMIGNLRKKKRKSDNEVARLIASADAARDRGAYKEAAAGYHKVLSLTPDRVDLWVQYGNMLKDGGELHDAEAAYLEAISRDPTVADTYLQYGHLLKRAGRIEEAVGCYRKAVALDPAQNAARAELSHLAERGVKSASAPLPSTPPRGSTVNVKLLSARKEIAELLGFLNRRFASLNGAGDEARSALDSLAGAYDAVSVLLRELNAAGSERPAVNGADRAHAEAAAKITIVFDISDLYQYFAHHRLPTGIQRVQIEVIPAALVAAPAGVDIRIVCFTETGDFWREIPAAQFQEMCELALEGNDITAADWRELMASIDEALRETPRFAFPQGAFLINIGTSWWLQNYFLRLREAKATYGIRYVPFVHDMIPIITPEFCVAGLTQDFISWVLGVFHHADHYLVNSEATKRDLEFVAAEFGHRIDEDNIVVVRLDADFRKPGKQSADRGRLVTHRLKPGGYVLFVGTIEPRKNHLLAFAAWLRLIRAYGPDRVPRLVCIGIRGWLNDVVFAQLGAAEDLRNHVTMLASVPDDELALLYENCLFTVYPSLYEGWGLPVTESLCHGKVPVTCRISSLPEAGGAFAEYFDPGDEDGFVAVLRRLIFDDDYRQARERAIRQNYKPRAWQDVSATILAGILDWAEAKRTPVIFSPQAEPRVYYPLSRNAATRLYKGMKSGEAFRAGEAWWGCDDWGCWLKRMPGRLVIGVGGGPGRYRFYLGLRGLPNTETTFDVAVIGNKTVRGVLKADQRRWIWIDLDLSGDNDATIEAVIEGYQSEMESPREDLPPRAIALGVIGFMLCREEDVATRIGFVEAVALDNLEALVNAGAEIVPLPSRTGRQPALPDGTSRSELQAS